MVEKSSTEHLDGSGGWRNRLFNSPGAEGARVQETQPKPYAERPNPPNPKPRAVPELPIATVGATLSIKGDVSAQEDLLVKGTIQGNIIVKEHHVEIDEPGRLDGNIVAKQATIRGEAKGDIQGLEMVSILATGKLEGTISASRVVLEDGGWFKGLIDMPSRENAGQAEAHPQQRSKRPKAKEPAAGAAPRKADQS